jgi:hypothetical protein
MAAPSQRIALATLFAVLALVFAGFAYAAGLAHVWVITVAAAVLALWMAQLAWQMARRRPRR